MKNKKYIFNIFFIEKKRSNFKINRLQKLNFLENSRKFLMAVLGHHTLAWLPGNSFAGVGEGSLCAETPSPKKKTKKKTEKRREKREERESVHRPEGWGLENEVIHFYNMTT